MHVISKKPLREFWSRHPGSEEALKRWYKIVSRSEWKDWAGVKEAFPHADLVMLDSGAKVVVFNVKGNDCRLVARVLLEYGRVYVRRVMTHSEYSKDRWKEAL